MSQQPWTFQEPTNWDEMSDIEKSEYYAEQRQLAQAQRQYQAQNKTLRTGLTGFIRSIEQRAQRKARKLKASPFWRND